MYKVPYPSINCKGKLIEFSSPKIMGILNLTPDSFYDGGKYTSEKNILLHVERMINDGVDIIDLGAASTRPGADILTSNEEIKRIEKALTPIIRHFPEAILSIDTYQSEVARYAIEQGGAIINDVSGGQMDSKMFSTIAELQVPYMLMHMKGTPASMQSLTDYTHLLDDLVYFFSEKITKLHALGVNDIIIDPGFGFAKTVDQNYDLLKKLKALTVFDLPILVGLSRKSMLYKYLDIESKEALNATSITNFYALQNGANILRVHDVKEAKECIQLFQKLKD